MTTNTPATPPQDTLPQDTPPGTKIMFHGLELKSEKQKALAEKQLAKHGTVYYDKDTGEIINARRVRNKNADRVLVLDKVCRRPAASAPNIRVEHAPTKIIEIPKSELDALFRSRQNLTLQIDNETARRIKLRAGSKAWFDQNRIVEGLTALRQDINTRIARSVCAVEAVGVSQ